MCIRQNATLGLSLKHATPIPELGSYSQAMMRAAHCSPSRPEKTPRYQGGSRFLYAARDLPSVLAEWPSKPTRVVLSTGGPFGGAATSFPQAAFDSCSYAHCGAGSNEVDEWYGQ